MSPALPRSSHGPGSRYTARAAFSRARPNRQPHHVNLTPLVHRITDRDQWLAWMLHEHRVLTTRQITRLAFPSLRTAQRRLRALYEYALLDSFRPLVQSGSGPEHYTLGPAGAALLAAQAGCDPSEMGWRPSHTGRIAYSPTLGHDLGTNELLTLLAAHAHTTHTRLTLWLSARSSVRRWGDLVHPDAYAHWYDDGWREVPFFLEYDTGSEQLARVEAKLASYAAFTTATGARPALLIHTRTASREAALRRRLTEPARSLHLRVATASADFTTDTPWGRWWLPLDPPARRTELAALASRWPDLTPAYKAEASEADSLLTLPVPPLPPTNPTSRR
ncbi:replication-relaxation family protein [Streptomyces sp. B15]|uniref:replication-relaxation family protein n=1 Tax=Streptomyces sp. B15 TaxID=1537797 RepID=UPI001B3723EF|nr:replication-relaxation family protein [Streptomyces sp. B15]MBQ1123759.1 replication-relaxation family protein [Streptomyces sp. B15]